MATLFLIIIYITFVSLGLPDAALGAVWPVTRLALNVPLDAAGIITMTITGGTVISSLFCEKAVSKLGTGKVVAISTVMTASALIGFSLVPSFWWMVLLAVPLGLGAGAIDSALNNFVALHYSARVMNWLHCFWGVGAASGPILMSFALQNENNWRGGYRLIGIIQAVLSLILFLALPLWKQQEKLHPAPTVSKEEKRIPVMRIPGVIPTIGVFLLYCSAEWSAGLWSSSYLVDARGFDPVVAARASSLFFAGITLGRFLAGVVSNRLGSKNLIRIGLVILLSGTICMVLPLPGFMALVGIGLMGFGCAPIFPTLLHLTPARFGIQNSQRIVSLQMASAYLGNTIFPPLLGFVAARTSLAILPFFIFTCTIAMLFLTEYIIRIVKPANILQNGSE